MLTEVDPAEMFILTINVVLGLAMLLFFILVIVFFIVHHRTNKKTFRTLAIVSIIGLMASLDMWCIFVYWVDNLLDFAGNPSLQNSSRQTIPSIKNFLLDLSLIVTLLILPQGTIISALAEKTKELPNGQRRSWKKTKIFAIFSILALSGLAVTLVGKVFLYKIA